MFGLFGGGGFGGGSRFEAHYRCYPVTFIDKPEAERGDKIFLPPSALDRLAQLQIDYPMLFQVENRREGRSTHCGVLEFIAEEGMVYMPYWMMQNLLLAEGDVVTLRSATLPKGSYVKLQPHSKDFLDITNPRAVLETTLRNFSCLTVGDTVPIRYNNKAYFIDIVEAKPAGAISVIETDCNVDFAPPLDYVEPDWKAEAAAAAAKEAAAAAAKTEPVASDGGASGSGAEGEAAPEEPSFLAFAGSGRRLDGKAVGESRPVAVPLAGARPGGSGAAAGKDAPASGSVPKSGSAPGRKAGKLMFKDRLAAKFADKAAPGAAAPPPPPPEPKADDKPEGASASSFQAFKGTANKLK